MPLAIKSRAVTPKPSIWVWVKWPSSMWRGPQEGELSLRIAIRIPKNLQALRAASAPALYCWVTSLPLLVRTLFLTISAGSRGVGRPPETSGQKGTSSYFFESCSKNGKSFVPPSYLHFSPVKQALIKIFSIAGLVYSFLNLFSTCGGRKRL